MPAADPAETLPSGEPLEDPVAPPVAEMADGCGAERPAAGAGIGVEGAYTRGAVSFTLQFQDELSPYRVMSAFVLPGETLSVEAVLGDPGSRFEACATEGSLRRLDADEWEWTAPEEPGLYAIDFDDEAAGERARLNVFVLRPYDGSDSLNGYRIGAYERLPLRGLPAYEMPGGFIEVEPELEETWVSPHFQLRQFLCKQAGGYPKYMALSSRLLLKLEMLLERFNDRGIAASTFAILSGYRTPHYNRSIGNSTKYTRHAYGDAADIYIDEDGDGQMDDLDGDGAVTRSDARLLFSIVDGMVDESWYRPFMGGMGLYGPAPHRGPFIHVDTRGLPRPLVADARERKLFPARTPTRRPRRAATRRGSALRPVVTGRSRRGRPRLHSGIPFAPLEELLASTTPCGTNGGMRC